MQAHAPAALFCQTPDFCSHCEERPAVAALKDGRLVCRWCHDRFAVCAYCKNDVEIRYAAHVEDGDGYAHDGCLGGPEDY